LASNVIDEIESHREKHDGPRISISHGISMSDEFDKLRINVWWDRSIRKSCSKTNIPFPDSMEHDKSIPWQNAEPWIN
jgi:hypothetical protein